MEDQALYQWIDNGKPSSVRVQRTKSSIPEGKKSLIWLSDMQPGNKYVKKQLQKSLRRRKNSKNVIAAAS